MFLTLLALSTTANATTCWSGKHIEKGTLTCYATPGLRSAAQVVATIYGEGEQQQVALEFSGWTAHFTLYDEALVDPAGSSGTLTLLDAGGGTLASFGVRLDGDSEVTVSEAGCGCTTRGCVCESTLETPVLRRVGDAFALELTGAEVDRVASVRLDLTVPGDGTSECPVNSRTCTSSIGTAREYSWNGFYPLSRRGRWDGEYDDGQQPGTFSATRSLADDTHTVFVDTYDADGVRMDRERILISDAVDDGAEGRSAIPLEQDPYTTLTLLPGTGSDPVLAIVSDGWSRDDSVPNEAIVSWEGGDDWRVPVTSVQAATWVPVDFRGDPTGQDFTVVINGRRIPGGIRTGGPGFCRFGACYCVSQSVAGDWGVSVTVYGDTAASLPSEVTVALLGADGAVATRANTYRASLGDELSLVFATELALAEDPSGVEVGGELDLRGVGPGRSGQRSLASGRFEGELFYGPSGDVGLGANPRDGGVQGRGDVLVGGAAVAPGGDMPPAVIFLDADGFSELVTAVDASR